MKTAEEELEKLKYRVSPLGEVIYDHDDLISAMKKYALNCSIVALKDAADNFDRSDNQDIIRST